MQLFGAVFCNKTNILKDKIAFFEGISNAPKPLVLFFVRN